MSGRSDPLIKRQENDKERKDFVLSLEGKEIHRYIQALGLPPTPNTHNPSLIIKKL